MKELDKSKFWIIRDNPIIKTGVFPYLGRQISPDLNPTQIYNVLRPEDELFKQKTIDSFNMLPITIGHALLGSKDEGLTPPEEKGIEGTTGEHAKRTGDKMTNTIKLYSERIKDEINNGKKELSAGYFCDFMPESGTYQGRHYDYVQRNIDGNHIALVEKGRNGSDVRVMDSAEGLNPSRQFVCDAMELGRIETAQDENDSHDPKNGQFASKGISLTGKELGEYKDAKELRQKAVDYYKANLQGKTVKHPKLGEILFSRPGMNKFINSGADEVKIKMITALPTIIEKGEYVGEEKPEHDKNGTILKFHRIKNTVELEGKTHKVSVLIWEDRQGNKFYNLNPYAEEYQKVEVSVGDTFVQRRAADTSTNSIGNKAPFVKGEDVNLFIEEQEDLSSKNHGNSGQDAATGKENKTMDKREIIREIMAVAAKPADQFQGGEEEREKTIAELAEKIAYKPSESGANDADADPKEQDPKPAEKDAEDKGAGCDADEADKTEKDEEDKKPASLDEMEKELLARLGRKAELVSKLTPIIGAFDSASMTEKEVAAYACEKLNIKAALDEAPAVLKGYLAGYKPADKRVTMKSAQDEAVNKDVLNDFKEGK